MTKMDIVVAAITLFGMRLARPQTIGANPVVPARNHSSPCQIQPRMFYGQFAQVNEVGLVRRYDNALLIKLRTTQIGVLNKFVDFKSDCAVFGKQRGDLGKTPWRFPRHPE